MRPETCLVINVGLCSFNAMEYFNSGMPTFAILAFVSGIGAVLSLHEMVRGEG